MLTERASPRSIVAGRYDAPDNFPYRYFPAGEGMIEHFDRWINKLHAAGDFREMSSVEFAVAIAEPWGEMNVEGNTRAQVAFFTYFARQHGHTLDYRRFADDIEFRLKFNAGRFLVQANLGSDLLIETISQVIDRDNGVAVATQVQPRDHHPKGALTAQRSGDERPLSKDDYKPHYVSQRPVLGSPTRSGLCGATTTKNTPCQRRGRCPYHG